MPRRPIRSQTLLTKDKRNQLKYNPGNQSTAGEFQTMCIDVVPEYNVAENERLYLGKTNATVVR